MWHPDDDNDNDDNDDITDKDDSENTVQLDSTDIMSASYDALDCALCTHHRVNRLGQSNCLR